MKSGLFKFAVPVVNDGGLDARVSGHFGRAPGFMTLWSDGSGATFHDSRSSRQASECAPVSMLSAEKVVCVAAKSMGKGALHRCHQAGLRIYQTQAASVRELLVEIRDGVLIDFPDEALCGHAHDDHAHTHHSDGHTPEAEFSG